MLSLLPRRLCLGLEITSAEVRLAALSGRNGSSSILSLKKADLQPGQVTSGYSSLNIQDPEGVARALRSCLEGLSVTGARRAALSLPDGVFRVQTIEFDQLPGKTVDRERLIRWRLEKGAAFDIKDTLLRYQVLRRQQTGFTVLVSVAKEAVIGQYEELLTGLGLESWNVGISAFHALNFYSPYMVKKSAVSAMTHVTDDSFTTVVAENGEVRFYRFKETKRAGAGELRSRLVREIEDSLHFYTHMDPQQAPVGRLYLAGDSEALTGLAEELAEGTALDVEVLSPAAVLLREPGAGPEMAAALGAGGTI